MSFDTTLRRKVRRLPDYPVPPALRPRLIDRLGLHKGKVPLPLPRMKPILAGIAAVTVVGFGIKTVFYLEDSFLKVNQAVLKANSFHFVGWQLKEGQQVRWEVWGRRNPIFYREQVGDEITVISGNQSFKNLPSKLRNEKNGLIYVVQPAKRLSNYYMKDHSLARLAGTSLGFLGNQHPETVTLLDPRTVDPESTTVWQLNDNTKIITVDKETHLPTRLIMSDNNLARRTNISYTVKSKGETRRLPVTGQLDATYNISIPTEIEQFEPEPNSSLLPLGLVTKPIRSGEITRATGPMDTYASKGLTVDIQNAQIDAEGNLRVLLNASVGGRQLSASQLHLHIQLFFVNATITNSQRDINKRNLTKEDSIPLLQIPSENQIKDNGIEIVLVPAEPLQWNKDDPHTIQISGMLVVPLYKPDMPSQAKPSITELNMMPLSDICTACITEQFNTQLPFTRELLENSTIWKATGQKDKYEKAFFRPSRSQGINVIRASLAENVMNSSSTMIDSKGKLYSTSYPRQYRYSKLAAHWWKLVAEDYEKSGMKAAADSYREREAAARDWPAKTDPNTGRPFEKQKQ